jgi:hypothetical protein
MDIDRELLGKAKDIDPDVQKVTTYLGCGRGLNGSKRPPIVCRLRWVGGKETDGHIGWLDLGAQPVTFDAFPYAVVAASLAGIRTLVAEGPDAGKLPPPWPAAPGPDAPILARIEWWREHGEVGTSSRVIFDLLSSAARGMERSSAPTPADADDFRRCSELLCLVPGWRAELGDVADAHPNWRGLVDAWGELEGMLSAGNAEGLTARIQGLTNQGPRG